MKQKNDVSYYCEIYPEDYAEFQEDLGCIWCYKIVAIQDAQSHIIDPVHIENKKKGFK